MNKSSKRNRNPAHRRGFTLVEMQFAAVISAVVAIGGVSLMIVAQRMLKGTFTQQLALKNAKEAAERISREIRMANTSVNQIKVFNASGVAASNGNKIEFGRTGEPTNQRRIELLPGADNSYTTAWDNILRYDPNTAVANNEEILVRGITSTNATGAFTYLNVTSPIQIRLRVGDPLGMTAPQKIAQNARTGVGMQGAEINMMIFARN